MGIADQDTGMQVKFMYDHVFGGAASNADVYGAVASPIVASALDGINGTIFAYGVTSSGKTHTMMGSGAAPGMVPQAIAQVFATVARAGARTEFTLRLSMMEIYNEVLNDLLDPARSNLKLREDPRRGVGVEGITEENLVSAEHAIQVIARGNENRKVRNFGVLPPKYWEVPGRRGDGGWRGRGGRLRGRGGERGVQRSASGQGEGVERSRARFPGHANRVLVHLGHPPAYVFMHGSAGPRIRLSPHLCLPHGRRALLPRPHSPPHHTLTHSDRRHSLQRGLLPLPHHHPPVH